MYSNNTFANYDGTEIEGLYTVGLSTSPFGEEQFKWSRVIPKRVRKWVMSTPPKQTPPQQRQQGTDDIRVVKGLDAIRLRPGMYMGATPAAIYDMLYKVLDESLNDAMAGLCDHIEITIHPDSSITVSDNGEGIPVEIHSHLGISLLELDLTSLAIPGRRSHLPYRASGGLHGIGLIAVNALSAWLIAEVRRDGHLWRQSYVRGIRTSDVVKVRRMASAEPTGTSITFYPDDDIFNWKSSSYDFDYEILSERCRQLAYVLSGVTLRLIDQRGDRLPRETTFYFEDSLVAYVKHLNHDRSPLHVPISGTKIVQLDTRYPNRNVAEVSFAFQYTSDEHTTEVIFVNSLETPDGGTHLTGLRTALTRTINQWAYKTGNLRRGEAKISGSASRNGLTAVVSLKHPFPHFESMVKVKLINPEVNRLVASSISTHFAQYLERNPEEAQCIFDNCCRGEENA